MEGKCAQQNTGEEVVVFTYTWASSWARRASPAESSCTPFSSNISSTRSKGIPRFPDSDKDQATSAMKKEDKER